MGMGFQDNDTEKNFGNGRIITNVSAYVVCEYLDEEKVRGMMFRERLTETNSHQPCPM